MPETRTYQIYKFEELSERAKENARDWWRQARDTDDLDNVIEDAVTCGNLLGIEFDKHAVKLMGGGTRYDPKLWWTLSYCQGDGVSFDGCYKFAAPEKIREHAPVDEVLHGIADRLYKIQKPFDFKLQARITSRSQYNSITTEVEHPDSEVDVSVEVEKAIDEEMEAFCSWVYKQLRAEDEYQTSAEYIDEIMESNEYTFDVNGKRRD